MAITMPSIDIKFKQLAGTLIERSARGIAIIIIKDDTDKTFIFKEYKDSTEVEKDNKYFTSKNKQYIKDVLTFQVNKCVVVRIDEVDGILNDGLDIIVKNIKTGWVTIADGTQEEFSDLTSWIKARELEGKTYKAVVYKIDVTDCRHVVNFYNEKVIFKDSRGEMAGAAYCPSLIGILATCNIQRGSTYYECGNLERVVEVGNSNEFVGNGKFILINDEDSVKIALGINSLNTTNGITLTEDMKFIDTVEVMDLISDDISNVFKNEYLGKYKNNLDNQILFISSINTYFAQLANDYILDNNYSNKADVDVEEQRLAWIGVGKTEAKDWDIQQVKYNSFKRTVFILADIKILGSMENLSFEVSLF